VLRVAEWRPAGSTCAVSEAWCACCGMKGEAGRKHVCCERGAVHVLRVAEWRPVGRTCAVNEARCACCGMKGEAGRKHVCARCACCLIRIGCLEERICMLHEHQQVPKDGELKAQQPRCERRDT
jgi:hypothetical protein